MRAGYPLLLILLIGLLPLGAMTTTYLNGGFPLSDDMGGTLGTEDGTLENGMNRIPVPGPDLGQANWSSNHFENPGFEDWSSAYEADGWSVSKTGNRHHWVETTQVNEGSYSAGYQCQNYPDQTATATLEQTGIDADFSNITLEFDWYLDQNENPIEDVMYAEVQLQDGVNTYWLFYFLNGTSSIDQNSTWEGYFIYDLGPAQQWNTLTRNLTSDFLSVSQLAGSYSENIYVDNIRFQLQALGGTDQLLRGYIDNVKLLNETDGYYWINGTNRNGNFETGDFTSWTVPDSSDAGKFERSTTAHEGTYSANLTAYSFGNYSYVNTRDYPYTRLTSLNQGHVSMRWYLTFDNLTANTYACIIFRCRDGAATRNVYYMLGYGGSSSPVANSSFDVVLHPNDFNTTGSWKHLDVNLWSDANSHFSLSELMIWYVEVFLTANGTDSLISTQIDSVNLRAAALNHAAFEDQPAVGQQVQGFTTTSSRMTVTGTAYDGSKAGNVTHSSGTLTLRHAMQQRPLNSTRETYLDVMWRIEDTVTANQVWFRLVLTDGRELNYYMNGMTASPSNSSSVAYFNVTGAGTTGLWMQMHRDLTHDYEAVFGSLPDITMEELYLRVSATARLEILFDDLYLYDDPAPQVSNVSHTPTTPDHQEGVQVSADVVEQDIQSVLAHYRVDGGSWQQASMTYQAGDTYSGTIPGQNHNAFVEYYVTATDDWGLTTTALDNGDYWNYTVTDQTAPSIDNVIQTPSPVGYTDTVNVTAEITEEGSGLQSIKVFYRFDGGAWENTTMVTTGFAGYYAPIGQQPYGTFVEYYVNATDNMDLQGISGTYSYTVTDTIPPVITNVAHTPTSVEYTHSPTVSCNVTDSDSGIDTVVIYYRVDGGGWNTVTMSPTSGTGFAGSIPAQAWNAQVQYYVNATDNAGAWGIDDNSGAYYGYTVDDTVNPLISNHNRNPITVEYTVSPVVSFDVIDAGSDVDTVTLYYRVNGGGWNPVSMSPATGNSYEGSIPVQSWDDDVEYYVVAFDNAGNSATEDNGGSNYSYTVVDNTDPDISNVGHTPGVVTSSDPVTVGCDVIDDGSGVSTVTLWYQFDSGGWSSMAMGHTSGNHYEATIGAMPYDTFTEYYIVATDSAGNSATDDASGGYYYYTVTETTPPNISNISHSPTPVEYTDNPDVSCDVTDTESGVGTVTLYYRVNGGGWSTVAMNPATGDSYEGTIPAQAWNDLVEYYVNASDTVGNFAVNDNGGSYYSYTVQDTTDPIISNLGRTPLNPDYTDSPVISCDVSDPGSDIDYIRLYYRIDGGSWFWVAMTHTTGIHYETTLSAYVYDTLVEYYFVARDNAANTATDDNTGSYYSYRVDDFTDPLISSVDHSPSTVEYDDTPVVGCDVTDGGSGVSSVVLYYRVDGGSWTQVAMSGPVSDHYEGTIPVQSWNSVVQYYANATDIAGNWIIDDNTGSYYSYTVVDNTDPVISEVGHTPIVVSQFDAPIVGCNVSDPGSGVSSVQLHYRVDGGSWDIVAMSFTSGDHYEGTIPVQALNAFVEYYIDATDNAANNAVENNGGSYYTYTVGDLNPPVISNVGHTPSPVQYNDTPVIGCDVVDIGSGIASVVLAYRIDGGAWTYVAMTHTTGNRYAYTFVTQPYGTLIEYWMNATDNVDNWQVEDNSGLYYNYTVTDSFDPVIISLDTAPSNVEYDATPTIGCDVSDVGCGIQSALLVYRVDGGSWTTLVLAHTSGNHYQVTLSSQIWQTQIDYYFNITDNAGNWVVDDNDSSYYSYTVIDSTDPALEITNPNDGDVVNDIVTISMTASDPGSGIARIEVFIDGTEVGEITSAPFTFNWNTTLVLNGAHDITVTVYDNAGNEGSQTISVTVNNVIFTPQIPVEIIIFGGIVTIAAVACAGIVIFRRRRKWGD